MSVENGVSDPTPEQIRALAKESNLLREGELELDPGATVSIGDDNGAYVQTWMWISFAGTPWDKDD